MSTEIDLHNGAPGVLLHGPARYCFLDVETTGFDAYRNCIITLAAFITDAEYNVIQVIDMKVRPDGAKDVVWSEGAEKVHGITWEQALSFPDSREQAQAFMDALSAYKPLTFVAHNAAFDARMVKGWLAKADLYHENYALFRARQCTVEMVKNSGLTSGKSKSLGAVCTELGIEHVHHDAMSDAYVLIEIHRRCMERAAAPQTDMINEIQEPIFANNGESLDNYLGDTHGN